MQERIAWRQGITTEENLSSTVDYLLTTLSEKAEQDKAVGASLNVNITPLPHGSYAKYHVLVLLKYSTVVAAPVPKEG